MNICAFNGSPRGTQSNSNRILDWMIGGMALPVEKYLLKNISLHADYVKAAQDADLLLFVMPLYTDGMPGIVMKFIEVLGAHQESLAGKKVLYVIHSGFPESCHSQYLKTYLERLTEKMNWQLVDVVIKGGSESFRAMPENALEKHKKRFSAIGSSVAANEAIDPDLLKKLATPVRLNGLAQLGLRFAKSLGILDLYFKNQLKENNALDKSFDRPYLKS